MRSAPGDLRWWHRLITLIVFALAALASTLMLPISFYLMEGFYFAIAMAAAFELSARLVPLPTLPGSRWLALALCTVAYPIAVWGTMLAMPVLALWPASGDGDAPLYFIFAAVVGALIVARALTALTRRFEGSITLAMVLAVAALAAVLPERPRALDVVTEIHLAWQLVVAIGAALWVMRAPGPLPVVRALSAREGIADRAPRARRERCEARPPQDPTAQQ